MWRLRSYRHERYYMLLACSPDCADSFVPLQSTRTVRMVTSVRLLRDLQWRFSSEVALSNFIRSYYFVE